LLLSPESLVALAITEHLLDHEAVLIMGAERYNNYKGYSSSFRYDGNHKDPSTLDSFMRKNVSILAIDAIDFARTTSPKVQYKIERILREVNKAYVGFYGSETEDQTNKK